MSNNFIKISNLMLSTKPPLFYTTNIGRFIDVRYFINVKSINNR